MKTLNEITTAWQAQDATWIAGIMDLDEALAACHDAASLNDPPSREEFTEFGKSFINHTDRERDADYRHIIFDILSGQGVFDPEHEHEYPKLPIEELPPIVRNVILAAERQLNTSPEMAMTCALSAIAISVQGRYNVEQPHFGELPLNQFTLNIARTGVGKNTIFNRITEGITRFQQEDIKRRKNQMAAYTLAMASYKKRQDSETAKLDQDEILRWLDANPAPKRPMKSRRIETKFTTGGLLKLFIDAPSLGLFNPEAGSFFDSYSMNNQVIEFMATLCDLWAGDPCSKETGVDSIYVAKRRLSALLMVQPDVINGFLTDPRFSGQGITNRFLIVTCPPRARLLSRRPKGSDSECNKFNDHEAFRIFNQRLYDKISETMDYNEFFELNTKLIPFDGEGRADADSPACCLIMDWHDSIVRRMNDPLDRPYELIEGFANRVHEFAYKIAGALAAFDNKPCIGLVEAKAAVALTQYFLDERLRIEANTRPRSRNTEIYDGAVAATKFLQRQAARTGESGWSERELRNSCRVFKTDKRERIIKEMIEQGWVTRTVNGTYANKETYALVLTKQGKRQKFFD